MKFGGASVATPQSFARIADIIAARKQETAHVVVVVSAMGNTTDDLLKLAHQVNPRPPRRELDMLVSVGERISISLLAMSLAALQLEAISFTGSQSGIITCGQHTDARIIDVQPHRIQSCLEQGKIVIVAGFQGVSREKEITTLGRGGSDTTAVALAVALGAEKVEFYKDVPGIFSHDPKADPEALFHTSLTYERAEALAADGAKILHLRCIQLAKVNGVPIQVRSFQQDVPQQFKEGTLILGEKRTHAKKIFE